MKATKIAVRFAVLMAGLLICAAGIVFTVKAGLGVSPWDVFHIGVTNYTHFSLGRVQQMTGFGIILITIGLTRQVPQIGTFLNMFFIGFFVDQILRFGFIPGTTGWVRYVYLALGILLSGGGSGVYLAASLGAGPRDGLMLYLSRCRKTRIRTIRTAMEVMMVTLGYFLGGPVGVGTVFVSLGLGPAMEASIHYFGRHLRPLAEETAAGNVGTAPDA
ncbi:MAG: YczE/YyaS/YitT family protein [bacterium]|jgi:uncharacterized membrane protein YczE